MNDRQQGTEAHLTTTFHSTVTSSGCKKTNPSSGGSRQGAKSPTRPPNTPAPTLSPEIQVLYDLIAGVDSFVKQIFSEIALLRSELAQKLSFDEMHQYVDSAFLDFNSKLENIQQNYSPTVVNTDEVRKIVREEAFCLEKTERRKIKMSKLPEN
jgi:hypothetical protein